MSIPTLPGFRRALAGTPMAAEAASIYQAAIAGGINPALVVGIAGAESSFGTKGYAIGRNNPFGLMGFSFPNYTAATRKLAQTLNSNSLGYPDAYRKSGLNGMIQIYTPSGAANGPNNDPDGHTRNIINIGRRSGGDASQAFVKRGQAVAGGAGGATSTGAMADTGMSNPATQGATTGYAIGPEALSNIISYMNSARQSIREGKGKDVLTPEGHQSVLTTILGSIPRADTLASATGTPDVVDAASPITGSAGASPLANIDSMGIGFGGVDSRRVTRGGTGGTWGGSMPRALAFLEAAQRFGYKPNTNGRWLSQKRSRVHTASGGVSDHYIGNANGYGLDLGVPNTAEGDKLMGQLGQWFGVKPTPGSWLNVNRDGYRYQIGWRTPGHFDHIHVGVKKLT